MCNCGCKCNGCNDRDCDCHYQENIFEYPTIPKQQLRRNVIYLQSERLKMDQLGNFGGGLMYFGQDRNDLYDSYGFTF